MRIVKLGIISIVVFSVILFLMSLLLPSTVRVSRALNIEASPDRIQSVVSDIGSWPSWNELANEKINVRLVQNTPGLVATSWKYRDKELVSAFRVEAVGNVTVVQWYFDFRLNWHPWEKFGSITFDKQFGYPMERSLNNLKKLVEKSP